jgi:hypothetical protein
MSWNEDRDYYYEEEAAKDAFIEEISSQAISEFSNDLLRSFYEKNPHIMRPAVEALQEGKDLYALKHYSAALVFFMTSIELLFKVTVLKPVVYGLVHHEALADIIVQQVLGQTGFDRYEKLLEALISTFTKLELKKISRVKSSDALFKECRDLQAIRNKIIHQGNICTEDNTEKALSVAVAVYEMIVLPMIAALNLKVIEKGEITLAN